MGSKEKAHKLRHFRNHSRASQGELVVRNLPANVGDVRDPTLCDPMDCGPPGSFVLGIFLTRMLEWVATPSFRGSF